MRLALDTNRLSDLLASDPESVERLEEADEIWVPFVVLAEAHHGFRFGTKRAANEKVLANFLEKSDVGIAYADRQTVDIWAELTTYLKKKGRMIPINDLWIAALCVQNGLRLFTRDEHFGHLPQLLLTI